MTKPAVPHPILPDHEFDIQRRQPPPEPDPAAAQARLRAAELALMADLQRELLG